MKKHAKKEIVDPKEEKEMVVVMPLRSHEIHQNEIHLKFTEGVESEPFPSRFLATLKTEKVIK